MEIDVEDGADLLLQTTTGIPVSVHLDFYRRVPRRICVVQTTLGELSWDVLQQTVRWTLANGESEEQSFAVGRDELFRRQLQHFLDCAEGKTIPFVTLQDGIQVMNLIEQVRQADKEGIRQNLSSRET